MISVQNSQRKIRVRLPELQAFAESALGLALAAKPRAGGVLHQLAEVGVVLVSDARIAQLHKRFMDIAGPTDVMTFQHGEIFVSVETAKANAGRFGSTTNGEIRLYIAHGILHLAGYDDTTATTAAEMTKAQEQLVRRAEAAM